jgi:26S proteasome regulatory subunit T3
MAASAATPSLQRTLSIHDRTTGTSVAVAADDATTVAPLHRTLSCPSDFFYLVPPPTSQAEAVHSFAHGDVGDDDADLYELLHSLERELDELDQREQRVRVGMAELRREERYTEAALKGAQQQGTPPIVGQVAELVGEDHAIVDDGDGRPHGHYVRVHGAVDRARLKPSATVLLHASPSLAVLEALPVDANTGAAASSLLVAEGERPGVTYDDVSGCEGQKREVREAVELPLTHPELFARVGVEPPRGVLLCGPPGTGKTMLARAVAHHASAAFFHVSGPALVGKFLGEGPQMVRDVFRLAREKAPSIVFIDEVDAVATATTSASGADREVRRVLVELLAQMDGFDGDGRAGDGVRVIMATNRPDALDPALLRPGRLDRRVEFPLPDRRQKLLVFRACAAGMSMDGGVDLESLAARHDRMSAAEIAAVCFEAGMRAVRGDRSVVTSEDFEEGYRAVVKRPECGAYYELSYGS